MEWVTIIKEKGSSIKGEGFHKTIDGKFYCMAPRIKLCSSNQLFSASSVPLPAMPAKSLSKESNGGDFRFLRF